MACAEPGGFSVKMACVAFLLLAWCSVGLAAKPKVAYVSSAADFEDVFRRGAHEGPTHVVILEHLDLRELTGYVDPTDDCASGLDCYANKAAIVDANIRSVRGSCSGPLPDEFADLDPPLRSRHESQQQCVLLTDIDLFFFWEDVVHKDVWLANMLLRLASGDDKAGATLVFWQPKASKGAATSSLWMTDVHMQCDGRPQSRGLLAQFGGESSTVLMDGGSISNCNNENAMLLYNAFVALDNVSFKDNKCEPNEDQAEAGALQIAPKTQVRLDGVTFTRTTGGTMSGDIYLVAKSSKAFVADIDRFRQTNPKVVPQGGDANFEDTSDVQGSPFPEPKNAAFKSLRQEAKRARKLNPEPNDSGASAGLVAGIVIGVLVILAIIASGVLLLCWRRRRAAKKQGKQKAAYVHVQPAEAGTQPPAPFAAPLGTPGQASHSERAYGSMQSARSPAALPPQLQDLQATNSSSAQKYSFLRGNDSMVSAASDVAAPLQRPPSASSNHSAGQVPRNGYVQGNSSMMPADGDMSPAAHSFLSAGGTPIAGGASFASAASARQPRRLLVSSDPDASVGTTAVNTAAVSTSEGDMAGLECALDNLAAQRPPGLLAGRFAILRTRAHGGQALVQMARDHPDGFHQYAIKFFGNRQDYDREMDLYGTPVLSTTLPAKHFHCDNQDGLVQSPSGYVYPPFMVFERGTPLSEWLTTERSAMAVFNMFYDVAKQLVRVHSAGVVHRDLKPPNILWMTQSHTWKLIDYGIAAQTGAHVPAACSLAYACPETLFAYQQGEPCVAHPAQDIWALGVIVFAAITDTSGVHFSDQHEVFACAKGLQPYPWERRESLHPALARSRVRGPVLQCLSRNPLERPSAAELVRAIDRISNATVSQTQQS